MSSNAFVLLLLTVFNEMLSPVKVSIALMASFLFSGIKTNFGVSIGRNILVLGGVNSFSHLSFPFDKSSILTVFFLRVSPV